MGISPHRDAGLLTIVSQNGVSGLEVQHKGQWHTIEPLPGAFVVNVGDMCQVGMLPAHLWPDTAPDGSGGLFAWAAPAGCRLQASQPALLSHLRLASWLSPGVLSHGRPAFVSRQRAAAAAPGRHLDGPRTPNPKPYTLHPACQGAWCRAVSTRHCMQVLTNDCYQAPEHRVRASGKEPRQSTAFFLNPSYSASLAPLAACTAGPPAYR